MEGFKINSELLDDLDGNLTGKNPCIINFKKVALTREMEQVSNCLNLVAGTLWRLENGNT